MRTRQETIPRRYSRMGIGGDGSTLNLDFTAMSSLDSRFTFSRASTVATYINSSGYVATASGTNTPRFDYDPTTLAAKGLLIESAATNLLNFSETFATTGGTNNNWADTNLTRTSTNNTSPRNDATALRITASAANGTIISSAALGTSAARTLSVWLRRVTGTGNIQFTLDNGSTYTTQAITAAWVRYTFATTTAAQRVGFRIVTSADAIEIWGAQLEVGKGASSYIPTVESQVTRAIDSCTFAVTPANISLQSAPPATICYSANVHAIPTSSFPTIIGFQDSGGTTQVFRSQINSTTSNYITWLPTGAASNQANEITYSTLAQGVSFKVATSITSTFVTASRNGVAATAVSVGATYSFGTPDKIAIGILASNAAFTIANFKFFPSAKSQAELNALST